MKSIAVILSHISHPPFEKETYEREIRERLLVQELQKHGWNAKLYVLSYDSEMRQLEDEVCSIFCPIDQNTKTHRKTVSSKRMLKQLKVHRPDLILFKGLGYRINHWTITNLFFPVRWGLIVGGSVNDPLISTAEIVFTETQEQTEQIGLSAKRGRVALLPKVVRSEFFQESTKKDFDIVCVGSFKGRKNQMALEPFFSHYRVAFVGDGDLRADVEQRAAPFRQNVTFFGNLAPQDVPGIVSRSRLLVHPATSEGFPRVIVEAFACGVPVVALRATVGEIFEDGKEGLLVREQDLFHTVDELLHDQKRLLEMSTHARAYAERNCSLASVSQSFERAITALSDTPPSIPSFVFRKLSATWLGFWSARRASWQRFKRRVRKKLLLSRP